MKIPKILHQMFGFWDVKEKMPAKYKANRELWREMNEGSGWEMKLWGPVEARALIEKKRPDFLETYDGYKYPVQRCDSARYFILHEFGGVYADLDYVPNTTLDDMVAWIQRNRKHARILVNLSTNNPTQMIRSFSNSLMFSEKEAPDWEKVWQTLIDRRDLYKNGPQHLHVIWTTGPALIDAVYSQTKRYDPNEGKKSIVSPEGKKMKSSKKQKHLPIQSLPTRLFNPCGVCSHGGTCAAGAMAYHENTGSWYSKSARWVNYCMCNWIYFFIVIPLLIVLVVLASIWGARSRRCRGALAQCKLTTKEEIPSRAQSYFGVSMRPICSAGGIRVFADD